MTRPILQSDATKLLISSTIKPSKNERNHTILVTKQISSVLSTPTFPSISSNILRICLSAQWIPSINTSKSTLKCPYCLDNGYIISYDIFTPCPRTTCPSYNLNNTLILGNRYRLGKINGEGSFSKSYWAYDMLHIHGSDTHQLSFDNISTHTTALVSIKITHQKYSSLALREIKILKLLHKHDPYGLFHIVKLLDTFLIHPNFVCQVFEPLEHWTHPIMQISKCINSHKIEYISAVMHQLLSSICFIHSLGLIHADIKPDNIMYKEDLSGIRIIDFGNALTQDDLDVHDYQYDTIQSLRYRSPEVLLGRADQIHSGIDIWSIGCVICEILLGYPLFAKAIDIPSLWKEILDLCGTLPLSLLQGSIHQSIYLDSLELFCKGFGNGQVPHYGVYNSKGFRSKLARILQISDMYLIDLIARLLDPISQTRISASDALSHPFMRQHHLPSIPIEYIANTFK